MGFSPQSNLRKPNTSSSNLQETDRLSDFDRTLNPSAYAGISTPPYGAKLVPRLRFLVVARVEKPTLPQLEALRAYHRGSNLIQIQKALQAEDLQFGPFVGELAEHAMSRS